MALTRNQHAVHEVKGHYRKVSFSAHTGLVLDERIDLRLFHHSWQVAYAVSEEVRGETRHSIQLFDKNGIAAHKVYLQADADFAAYERLVADFTEDGADDLTVFAAVEPAEAEKPDAEVDVAGFQEAWLGMKDTHDFYMITRRFGLSRTQSLRLAPEGHAIQVDPSALRTAMDGARDAGFPVMFFVGSPGVIQIFTGEIHKLLEHGDWYNVMDPGFNLHVRETGIDAAWIVRKPTEDGIVTSLELYDEDGGNILMMFGARKPGKPELEAWRELADGIAGS